MPERFCLEKEKGDSKIGLDEETIRLLHSLNPEDFGDFKDRFESQITDETQIISFCAVS